MVRIIREAAILRGGDNTPTPPKLFDLNGDEFEVGHGPLNFVLPSTSTRTVCDEASIVPSGSLVVPSATLLLLPSVERSVIVVVPIPEIALSLLVAEATTALIPSKVPAVLVV